jgi:hypothetical protein
VVVRAVKKMYCDGCAALQDELVSLKKRCGHFRAVLEERNTEVTLLTRQVDQLKTLNARLLQKMKVEKERSEDCKTVLALLCEQDRLEREREASQSSTSQLKKQAS